MARAITSILAAALVLVLAPLQSAAERPPCGLVLSELGPCLPYVLRSTLMPADTCCNGVEFLGSRYAQDEEARQTICQCVQSSISPVLPIDYGLVNSLPIACNVFVSLPPISATVDCSTV